MFDFIQGVCEVLIRLNAVKPRKAIGRNIRELSSLEALTKITLERRQEIRKTKNKRDEIHLPNVRKKKENIKDAPLPSERCRRKTLCYGMISFSKHLVHSLKKRLFVLIDSQLLYIMMHKPFHKSIMDMRTS